MITILGLLATLVALLTALAMLKDTAFTAHDRTHLRALLRRCLAAACTDAFRPGDRIALRLALRFGLRAGVLILIVASSGVSLFKALSGPPPGVYEVLMRCGLVAFLAMQAPCLWLRWITLGDRRAQRRPFSDSPGRCVH